MDERTTVLPLGGAKLATERGAIEAWRASAHVAVFRWTGHADAGFVAVVGRLARHLEKPIRIFHDLSALESYESEARTAITELGIELLSTTERFDVFATSRIVRMGVTVISIPLLGKLYAHDSHRSLCTMIDATVAADHGTANFSTVAGLRTATRPRS